MGVKKLVLFLVALVAGWTVVVLFFGLRFMYSPAQTQKEDVLFEVEPGAFSFTASRLEKQGLTQDALKLRLLAKFTGYASKVKVGEYQLHTSMTPMEVLRIISSGKTVQRLITFSEGLNIFEISNLVESQKIFSSRAFIEKCFDRAFLKGVLSQDISSCEGYLFPETYSYTRTMSLEAFMSMMLKKFLETQQELELRYPGFYLNRHQVVTLASIVEKETGAPSERVIVSSVYQNRLRIGMRLQADPTVLYGKMEASRKIENNITRQDLMTPNRYNTYAMKGLPAGPIANPGAKSLEAVFAPATTEYLFFVSKNDGTHVFSKDYSSHSKNVDATQKNPEARKGKSWRDLTKAQSGSKSEKSKARN
jgi:UPF0755 protein